MLAHLCLPAWPRGPTHPLLPNTLWLTRSPPARPARASPPPSRQDFGFRILAAPRLLLADGTLAPGPPSGASPEAAPEAAGAPEGSMVVALRSLNVAEVGRFLAENKLDVFAKALRDAGSCGAR